MNNILTPHDIERLIADKEIIEVEFNSISKKNTGLWGLYKDIKVFIPSFNLSKKPSFMSRHPFELKDFLNKTLKVIVENKKYDFLIVNHSEYLLNEFNISGLSDKIQIGNNFKAKVKKINSDNVELKVYLDEQNFALGFIESNAVMKYVDCSNKLHELFRKNEYIDVELQYKTQKKLYFSTHHLFTNQFDDFIEKYNIGDTLSGTINRIITSGFYVNVLPFFDAFLRTVDIHVERSFELHDQVTVRILSINYQKRNVLLEMIGSLQSRV